jgi:ABC transporter with metal-binding/Fe-S-binding domain ATP-binding protein
MFHVPNIELTALLAEAIGLPLIQKTTAGEKENELSDLKEALDSAKARFQIEGVVTGAIKSMYQSTRIQKVCKELGLSCINPLWLKDQVELLNELVQSGFEVIISGVFAFPLDKSFLGRVIDRGLVERLAQISKEYSINPAGEGGELETTVLDAPFFKKKIEILDYDISYDGNSGVFSIRNARLVAK